MKMAPGPWVVFAALLAPFGACDQSEAPRADAGRDAGAVTAPVTDPARAEATAFYRERWAECHGSRGAGNGVRAEALATPLPDFRDRDWQAGVSDERIERSIVLGGPAIGRSADMPGQPDLGGRPQLVAALRRHVRSLAE
jgi:hypothetical protein